MASTTTTTGTGTVPVPHTVEMPAGLVPVMATFTALTCAMVAWLVSLHLRHHNRPLIQNRIIAVVVLLPLYSLFSLLSICYPSDVLYFNMWCDNSQAFALYSFLALLLAYFGADEDDYTVATYLETGPKLYLPTPFRWCYPRELPRGRVFLRWCRIAILSYCILKPSLAAFSLFLDAINAYSPGDLSLSSGLGYSMIISQAGLLVAFVALRALQHALQYRLLAIDPFEKFMFIYIALFVTSWQGAFMELAAYLGWIEPSGGLDSATRAMVIQTTLVIVEMFLLSIGAQIWFSASPYRADLPPASGAHTTTSNSSRGGLSALDSNYNFNYDKLPTQRGDGGIDEDELLDDGSDSDLFPPFRRSAASKAPSNTAAPDNSRHPLSSATAAGHSYLSSSQLTSNGTTKQQSTTTDKSGNDGLGDSTSVPPLSARWVRVVPPAGAAAANKTPATSATALPPAAEPIKRIDVNFIERLLAESDKPIAFDVSPLHPSSSGSSNAAAATAAKSTSGDIETYSNSNAPTTPDNNAYQFLDDDELFGGVPVKSPYTFKSSLGALDEPSGSETSIATGIDSRLQSLGPPTSSPVRKSTINTPLSQPPTEIADSSINEDELLSFLKGI